MDDIALSSPSTMDLLSMENIDFEEKYELKTDFDSIKNKLSGLYVKKGKESDYQLGGDDRASFSPDWKEIEASYYVEPGLKGLKKCVRDLTSVNKGDIDNLPDHLTDLRLEYFRFKIGVVWDIDKDNRTSEDGVIEFTDYDRDYISGICDLSGFWFIISKFDEEDLKVFNQFSYINHLNGIQKILDDVAPGRFDIRPELFKLGLIEVGVLNRNERSFYLVDDQTFEEAEDRYWEAFTNRSQEKTKLATSQIKELIATNREGEIYGDQGSKEAGERLQAFKNVMEGISRYYDEEQDRESKKN